MGKIVITSLGYMLPDYTFNNPLKKKKIIDIENDKAKQM
jgi:hypothetical protein